MPLVMSTVLTEIDAALAAYDTRRGRPVAIYLGERKLTQLTLDAARAPFPLPGLATDTGRPLTYQRLDLLRDELHLDAVKVV